MGNFHKYPENNLETQKNEKAIFPGSFDQSFLDTKIHQTWDFPGIFIINAISWR